MDGFVFCCFVVGTCINGNSVIKMYGLFKLGALGSNLVVALACHGTAAPCALFAALHE